MTTKSSQTTTNYQQVTVDVPEDRIAEFHAFFGRFLAGRGRRARYGRRRHGQGQGHGRGCAQRHEATVPTEAGEAPTGTAEV